MGGTIILAPLNRVSRFAGYIYIGMMGMKIFKLQRFFVIFCSLDCIMPREKRRVIIKF